MGLTAMILSLWTVAALPTDTTVAATAAIYTDVLQEGRVEAVGARHRVDGRYYGHYLHRGRGGHYRHHYDHKYYRFHGHDRYYDHGPRYGVYRYNPYRYDSFRSGYYPRYYGYPRYAYPFGFSYHGRGFAFSFGY
ncbi:MAG TPA: hypothetical protein VMY42_19050 [Thermoguttaceae bacterium]|nr:hypothetical protein [Thermoguttaceae bacterium]